MSRVEWGLLCCSLDFNKVTTPMWGGSVFDFLRSFQNVLRTSAIYVQPVKKCSRDGLLFVGFWAVIACCGLAVTLHGTRCGNLELKYAIRSKRGADGQGATRHVKLSLSPSHHMDPESNRTIRPASNLVRETVRVKWYTWSHQSLCDRFPCSAKYSSTNGDGALRETKVKKLHDTQSATSPRTTHEASTDTCSICPPHTTFT